MEVEIVDKENLGGNGAPTIPHGKHDVDVAQPAAAKVG